MTKSNNGAIADDGDELAQAVPLVPDAASNATTGVSADSLQIPLRFVDVVMVLPSTHPVVILEELSEPWRELRIPIGSPEGIAIAYAARKIDTPRPLTHVLFTSALESCGATLEVLRITGVKDNAFEAEIVLSGPTGIRTLACRPSDGIALALRQRLEVPISANSSAR
jgi:hypothetical protein